MIILAVYPIFRHTRSYCLLVNVGYIIIISHHISFFPFFWLNPLFSDRPICYQFLSETQTKIVTVRQLSWGQCGSCRRDGPELAEAWHQWHKVELASRKSGRSPGFCREVILTLGVSCGSPSSSSGEQKFGSVFGQLGFLCIFFYRNMGRCQNLYWNGGMHINNSYILFCYFGVQQDFDVTYPENIPWPQSYLSDVWGCSWHSHWLSIETLWINPGPSAYCWSLSSWQWGHSGSQLIRLKDHNHPFPRVNVINSVVNCHIPVLIGDVPIYPDTWTVRWIMMNYDESIWIHNMNPYEASFHSWCFSCTQYIPIHHCSYFSNSDQ